MSDDDSNDAVMVVSTDSGSKTSEIAEDTETRPIMQLFQRLINNDSKQNTVLTNAQIISILHKEFEIDITTLHELEGDIYLNVVKRFLKDWPEWDEFDQKINSLRKKKAYKSIKKTLEAKYIDLKDFLKLQLDATKPLAQEAVADVVKENAKRMKNVDTSDITLEVYCTRKQLNQLILSQPLSGTAENTVFNLTEFKPTSITVNKMPIESILNWSSVQVTIDTKNFSYQRTIDHQLKHVLVNSKNGPRNLKRELNSQIQSKDLKRISATDLDKEKVHKLFETLMLNDVFKQSNLMLILEPLFEIVKDDIQKMDIVKIPAVYKQYSNKYPYYRQLRKEVDSGVPSASYDLYIEETLSPMHTFQFGKPGIMKQDPNLKKKPWFVIECLECKLKFSRDEMYTSLREHFDMYHSNEPDWNCTNCEKSFAMTELARNKWRHICT